MADMNPSIFTDTTILHSLVIKLDEIEINQEDIVSFDMFWDKTKFSVNGNLVIKDNMDLANALKLNSKNILNVYTEDKFGEYYFRDYIITEITEIKDREKFKAFKFEFIDVLSYNMFNTYVSKSFKNFTVTDIIEDYFATYKWDDLMLAGMTREMTPSTEVTEYRVIPQDESFLEYITKTLRSEGYTWYQTRKTIVVAKKSDLIPSVLETMEYDYSQLHFNADHPFKIHDTKTVFNPIFAQSRDLPQREVFNYLFDSKTMPSDTSNLESEYSKIQLNNADRSTLQVQNGRKLYTQSSALYNKIQEETQDLYMQNTVLEIAVPGNFKHNKMYQNVNVLLSGNVEHIEGQAEGDITMSGLYTCIKVSDKVVSAKMIQKLTLVRVDFQEK